MTPDLLSNPMTSTYILPHSFQSLMVILLFAGLIYACSEPNREQTLSGANAEQIMNDFFTALSTADSTLLNRITTEDFTLYEHDVIWNRDSLFSLMPSLQGRIWEIRNAKVQVGDDLAHIHYYNVSRKPEGRSWLESALLVRRNDTLRIAFLHSTKLYLSQ